MKHSLTLTLTLLALAPLQVWSQLSGTPIPEFTATVLTGAQI